MSGNEVEWIEVANGPDLATARRNLAALLTVRGVAESDVEPGDLRIDTIRGEFEDRCRIMLKKEVAHRLGV
jgi:hypothetical protein